MSPSALIEPDRRAAMLRIVAVWLAVALLALAWAGAGVAWSPVADGGGSLWVALDPAQGVAPDDCPEPLHDVQSGGDGEAEPDSPALVAAATSQHAAAASRLSALRAIEPCHRTFVAYLSQAPPLA